MNKRTASVVSIVVFLAVLIGLFSVFSGKGKKGPGTPDEGPEDGGPVFTLFVPEDPQLIARHNRGVGLMGQFLYVEAREIFSELVESHPHWIDVKVNLAIATLNRQEEGDEQRALELLVEVLAEDPAHLRAHYCSGLLKLYVPLPEEAIEHFQFVAEADESDAYAAYYIGQCLSQQRDYEKALPWYEKSIELDNFLRSAYYGLAGVCQRVGQTERALELLNQFQKLKNHPRSRLIEFVYTRMGPKGEVSAIDLARPKPPVFPEGELFESARSLLVGAQTITWNDDPRDRPASITACDLNGDGNLDLFIVDALRHGDDATNAVIINNGDGTFALELDHILATVSGVNAALWGDFDNDGLTDVYLCRRGANQLWRQTSPDVWRDVTESTGTGNAGYDTVDGAMFDADHDGDLDIFCVNADGPNELLNNNLDGTFRPIARDQGLAGDGRPSRQVLITDLDRDRDVDIIVINESPPHEIHINDRGWAYRSGAGFDDFRQAEIRAAVAADVDTNGLVELYTLDSNGQVTRWKGDVNTSWSGHALHPADQTQSPVHPQLGIADVNGDGTINIFSSNVATWQVVSYQVSPGFQRPFLPGGDARLLGWAIVNLQDGRGPSVIALPEGGSPLIWDPGPARFDYVTLTFSGLEDKGKSMRSNASGIGTHVQVRIDSNWTTRDTFRASSGPGQSLQPLALGTAGHAALDFIKLDWSDGVLQSELHTVQYTNKDQVGRVRDFSAGSREHLEEIQRLTSSCPVLFAWNGEKYEFVSDVLGVGGLGYMVSPGEYARPRPWENLLLPEGLLVPRGDRFSLKLGEPMQETSYIDAVRLVQYDLPPGWKMTLDERMSILGPEPTGKPVFYRQSMLPSRATNDRGEDVTAQVTNADRIAAPVGSLDHRFIGRLKTDHVVTLIFDRPIDSREGGATLIADGWIEYPYSQTMFSAWQAKAEYRAPTIEARGADGEWVIVLEQFGYPAGMPRQMSVPLENLPPGTRALRISTNQEIYWDRLLIAWAEECPEAERVELPLLASTLLRRGFAKMSMTGQAVPYYDYDHRAPFWDTRTQTGMYTRFGSVDELVKESDDALAIIGPGEEVHFDFTLPETECRPGWTRRFVLETEGWCKDMDLYTKDGMTVEPLPKRRSDTMRRDALHAKYNTRLLVGE